MWCEYLEAPIKLKVIILISPFKTFSWGLLLLYKLLYFLMSWSPVWHNKISFNPCLLSLLFWEIWHEKKLRLAFLYTSSNSNVFQLWGRRFVIRLETLIYSSSLLTCITSWYLTLLETGAAGRWFVCVFSLVLMGGAQQVASDYNSLQCSTGS